MTGAAVGRRSFIRGALGVTLATGWVGAAGARSNEGKKEERAMQPLRLGGPVFAQGEDPEELALAHREMGYRAAYCPSVSLSDTDRIRAISESFAKHDVVIAEVGRWCNLMEEDPEKRKANLESVTEGLALADAIGAGCCVNIAGSYNKEIWYGPHSDNLSERFFEEAVENARKIINEVKPKRAKLCYEMMGWSLPDSPDSYLRVLKAVDREAFAVHLDPCNLVNSPERFYRNGDLIDECFEKLGQWIVSCHAKDLTWDVEMNVHFREVPVGRGSIDYQTYLKRLAALPRTPPLMLEHCSSPEEYDEGRRHILATGRGIGVEFG